MIDRPKGHFPVPALKYLRGPFLEFVRDVLDQPAARGGELFKRGYIDRLLAEPERHLTPKERSKLWQVAVLEYWMQTNGILNSGDFVEAARAVGHDSDRGAARDHLRFDPAGGLPRMKHTSCPTSNWNAVAIRPLGLWRPIKQDAVECEATMAATSRWVPTVWEATHEPTTPIRFSWSAEGARAARLRSLRGKIRSRSTLLPTQTLLREDVPGRLQGWRQT